MHEDNNFEIISAENARSTQRRFPPWMVLLVSIGVILLAFAAGMAFATYATRLNGRDNSPSPSIFSPTPTTLATAPISGTLPVTPSNPPALATPLVTLIATAAPTLTGTLTPTTTIQSACSGPVNAQFAPFYAQTELGCPLDPGAIVWSAWEPFERGAMLWRSDTDRAYAFFADGVWLTVDERWDNKEIPSRGDPPGALIAPVRGFGYVWAIRDDLFQRLGWATADEKGFCALVQSFQGGFILQSDTVEFCREQLYNQARAADWTPLVMVATHDGIWRKP